MRHCASSLRTQATAGSRPLSPAGASAWHAAGRNEAVQRGCVGLVPDPDGQLRFTGYFLSKTEVALPANVSLNTSLPLSCASRRAGDRAGQQRPGS